jgi:hypothetical protein
MRAEMKRRALDAEVTEAVLCRAAGVIESFSVLSVSVSVGVEVGEQGTDLPVLRFRVVCADVTAGQAAAERLGVGMFGPRANDSGEVEWAAWTGSPMFGVPEPSAVEGVCVAVVVALVPAGADAEEVA